MEYYVGLDVSLKQTSICVVDQTGAVVRESVVDSDPEAISAYVRSKAPGAVRIGLESDRNDAIGIACIMQTGWFKKVHVKDIDSHSVRALMASRALLVEGRPELVAAIRPLLEARNAVRSVSLTARL